jgi:hypothetical protein
MYMVQIVSLKPVETLIYISRLANAPIYVGTLDHRMWAIENGKVRDTGKSVGKK